MAELAANAQPDPVPVGVLHAEGPIDVIDLSGNKLIGDFKQIDIVGQLIAGEIDHIDRTFRMQHTDGHWIWLRVRCELSHGSSDAGLHLIGIAVDITEQKSLAEKTVEADLRLRDAIETIPEAFVLWDASNRLVLCNSHFQRLHKLPDTAVIPGTSY